MVEYRKLISFGKSSYVISLPKNWVDKNKLLKGSLIAVKEDDQNLMLSPKFDEEKEEPKKIRISVNGKDYRRLKREIIAAYINNFQTIVLYGEELKTKAKDLRDILHNIMALEIMEQTSDTVVAKDFLNMKKLDFEGIIRKMDIIFRSMLADAKSNFSTETYEHIKQREKDVDRLAFLIYRMVKYAMENPHEVRGANIKSVDLLNYWWLSNNLEKATDKIKHLAKLLTGIKVNKNIEQELQSYIERLEATTVTVMKSYYSKNKELAFKAARDKEPLIKDCSLFLKNNWKIQYLPEAMEHIKEAATAIHNIGRVVYS
ncbi:phosphate uptake regulator PhoU [Candidatus Woesearchaeota archaeon]|nr:phosphate uptake regulator PhoU [Candidatus Woesearchaeota archaeon]